jgi:ATP-binding cassette subfamily B protein
MGSRKIVVITLLSALLSTGSKLAIPLLAGKAINLLSQGNVDFTILSYYVIAMSSLLIIGTIFRYVFDYLSSLLGQNVVKKMRDEVYHSYLSTPLSYIDSKSQGDLLLRLINDVENVQNGLILGGTALFDGIVAILFTIGFMFSLNWVLALIVIVLTPLSMLISRGVSRFNAKYFNAQATSSGRLTGFINESLHNKVAIKSLGIEEERQEKYRELNEDYRKNVYKASFGASIINPSTRLVNSIINASVITCGALLIIGEVNIGLAFAVGDLSAFLVYASNYMQPFNEVSDVISEISFALASFKRIDDVVTAKKDSNEGKQRLDKPLREIEGKNVVFSYDSSRTIIKDISLKAKEGQKIALVGPTGCGKTTLINLIMRFYDPQEGSLYANGIAITELEKKSYRSHLGMVLQDSWIFAGTVYENIAYAKDGASKEEVIEASKKAQAHDFIERLPQGYDTYISDSSGLSLGEKQLIAVARVMLLSPEVVLLDEATSSIDVRTESLLSSSFDALMKGKLSFVVAHRLSTIVGSSLILVMKDGAIIESGTHQELMAKHGFYYELYNSQFAKY